MASINRRAKREPIYTAEGGAAARINPLQQLERLVMSCFLNEDEFYVDGKEINTAIEDAVAKVTPEQAAAVAIKAREQGNLRHVPLKIVRIMAKLPKHKSLVAETLARIIQRPDELSEFMAIYWNVRVSPGEKKFVKNRGWVQADPVVKMNKQPLSGQVKKGLAAAFAKFDEYALAKYNKKSFISLKDVMLLVHPKPKDGVVGFTAQARKEKKLRPEGQGSLLFEKLVTNRLDIPMTWEVMLTEAHTPEAKKQVWETLIEKKMLLAFAWLRNLRNMSQVGVDKNLIFKYGAGLDFRRILPFRFVAAAKYSAQWENEIEAIMLATLANYDKLPGETILLNDVSGSMDQALSGRKDKRTGEYKQSDMQRIDAACALAMIGREVCESARVFSFSREVLEVPNRRGFALRDAIVKSQIHGNTYMAKALEFIETQKYDRLIVISDEQAQDNVRQPKAGTLSYMINVASARNGIGYGKWVHLDGFSESIIKFVQAYEKQLD